MRRYSYPVDMMRIVFNKIPSNLLKYQASGHQPLNPTGSSKGTKRKEPDRPRSEMSLSVN